ncbi:Eco57I restriction-modification methylase domain-containing protein [Macrococcoides canis]|uniref:Eco57I restriction-modification methylase domain-containing protein n=1 Tax=Macrococcoides canis TaxID=1855823 RepID=UPI0020B6AD4B|nr:Eco57I restriction-modification methylase domain-containing protein [Macrococcus canis]UTH02872.1 Eco57I restriction-modification methylase domain-containing protein [Macrococcus canis]
MYEDIYSKGNDISETDLLRKDKKLLSILLKDYTTGQNIKWATDSYKHHGEGFYEDREITSNLITGWYDGFIQPRANKTKKDQQFRTKAKAEVFTPSWIVKLQVEAVLENMEDLNFEEFISTTWLEITCGEAPYMVNRYDMDTGELISLCQRNGFIDKKFQLLNQRVTKKDDWMKYAIKIFQSSYGYEYQGDSLLLARENLLLTFIDYYKNKFEEIPEIKLLRVIAEIISRNVFQMDGLINQVPYALSLSCDIQLNLFEDIGKDFNTNKIKKAMITNWKNKRNGIIFGGNEMRFDVVIGNPPYQNQTKGDNKTFAKPIYHEFLENAYLIANKAIFIHPARFLFNAGSTPKEWNKKMLSDNHLKVTYYNSESSKVFVNTDIKGGIAVTYRDQDKEYQPIDVFIENETLRSILNKTKQFMKGNIGEIIAAKDSYRFSKELHIENVNLISRFSKSHEYDVSSNIFSVLPEFFSDSQDDEKVGIHGRVNNERALKYINKKYIKKHPNLENYKVIMPGANGSGRFGEIITKPFIANPKEGHTATYISVGYFNTYKEAENLLKYIKTKFARALLGILKVTPRNGSRSWKYVPVQNFEVDSDIDWSKSISEIDQQLYKKYNLTEEEINFIEENVKEMD